MFISDFAIKRPIITITAMVALVAFGGAALLNLHTDEFPDIQAPVVGLTIAYPGGSPAEVEREIVKPIEDAIWGISGLDGDKSTCFAIDGLAQCTLFFDFEKPIQQASQDVRDAISTKREDLPPEMKEPILTRFDPSEAPVFTLVLTSPSTSAAVLTRIADPGLASDLRSIAGVAQVNVVGEVKRNMVVELRPGDLQSAGVSVAQVVAALQQQNLASPVGWLNGNLEEKLIRLSGRLQNATDFGNLVVADRGGQLIRLNQIANVYDGTEEPRQMALFNGKQAVGIEILKSKGYSTTQVASAIQAKVAELQKTLPPDVKFAEVQNAGERVSHAVRNVEEALVEGALLTVLVVFLFLNSWRSTVITGLALPVSVLASFVAVWAFGFTLNTMSLLGLSLAIGILIDDAIVVRENIVRHIELGEDHVEASHTGTDEIGLAVTATTFSIVAVFVPVAFMYGEAGQWFKPFALTIACSVLVSLFVSFSLDPMLSAYWPDPQVEGHGQAKRGPISRTLARFNTWFDKQADRYKTVIAWALDHRLAVTVLAGGSFVLALALQGTIGGVGFVPVSDRSEINLIVEAPGGSNLEYTRLRTEAVAELARRHPEVAYTYTSIGGAIPFRAPGVDQALIYVRLTPKAKRHISQDALGAEFRREFSHVAGATVSVFTSGFGGAVKQVQVQMRGPDPVVLTRLAEQAIGSVAKVPGAVDVGLSTRGEKPELDVQLNRPLAGSLGITVGMVAQSLRPAFAGLKAGDWTDPSGETRDVTVRLTKEARENIADLERLPLVVPDAQGRPTTLPLGQIANIRQAAGPAQINHLDREPVVAVEANVQGRPLSEVTNAIKKRLTTLRLPPGYHITQGGEARDQAEIFTRIFTALGIAILLMYLILVMQFGSFLDPIAILISLPLSLIGVVVALLMTGDDLNIMSLIGVMLLMGIVAKNAILLIDFAKWAREKGMSRRDALIEAGRIRLRPIIMTTLALIAGMLPVAIGHGEGADFRAPLGRAVIGGVITSTLLTLIVIPTIYEILDELKEKLGARFLGRKHGAAPPSAPELSAGD
jgi:hydrophobic/amphiphilic exporter-1 (mainly G- bacteria), HAE1 family